MLDIFALLENFDKHIFLASNEHIVMGSAEKSQGGKYEMFSQWL